jgi:hypothetical protein
MVGLSRSSIGRLAVSGYPGHIFVCKLRYGYGHQEYIEKLEILHSWYSDLKAYLPMMYKGKEKEYNEKLNGLMDEVGTGIDAIYENYNPLFEGQSLDPDERTFIKSLRAIKEQLDVITAESKIIEGIKADDGQELMAG